MKINRSSWHYKMIASDRRVTLDSNGEPFLKWEESKLPKDNCAYFWSFVLGVTWRAVLGLFILFVFGVILNIAIAEWLYGWYTLFAIGEIHKLWDDGKENAFWVINGIIVVIPIAIGMIFGCSKASPILSTKIEDLKEGRCSLIEYVSEGEKE
jgi:hypothetical protein